MLYAIIIYLALLYLLLRGCRWMHQVDEDAARIMREYCEQTQRGAK